MEFRFVQDDIKENKSGFFGDLKLDRSDQHYCNFCLIQGTVQLLKFNLEKGGDCEKTAEYNIFSNEWINIALLLSILFLNWENRRFMIEGSFECFQSFD